MNLKKIKRAIISVSDKSNLKILLPTLKKFKIEIISSEGSFQKIKSMKYKCTEVSNYTGFSEMLNGRIKTLHPKIHAGILNVRSNKNHRNELKRQRIPEIDLVIVDLYPFEDKLKEKKKFQNLLKYIDIGGTTLIRSAAKNFNDVAVICNTKDYSQLVKELKNNTPQIFFGAGSAAVLGYNNFRRKFLEKNTKSNYPKLAIRTMDRGHACGLHLLPFKSHLYLGASSAIFSTPEKSPRASSISFLLNDGMNQIGPFIGRSNVESLTYGFRPVSEDIFPMIGESCLKGIWYLNGTKRDGLTISPYICAELAKQMLGKKNKVEAITSEDLYLTVPKRKKKTIKAILEYEGPLETPIKKNEKIGVLKVYVSDELVKTIDVLSNEDIKRSNIFSRIFKSLNYLVWGDV